MRLSHATVAGTNFLTFSASVCFLTLCWLSEPLAAWLFSLCSLCFLLCDWLLMVRMRPCADGAQAPHWLPLCSCYCCHCSCAVSGQSHNTSSFFFVNVFMSCLTPTFSWCFSSLCCFCHLFSVFFPLPCSTTSCLFPLFSCPYLSHLSLFLMACQHLASAPPPQHLPPPSHQHLPHLTWLWTPSHAPCVSPHHFRSQAEWPQCLSQLSSD